LLDSSAETILNAIRAAPNELAAVQRQIDDRLEDARIQRESLQKPVPKKVRPISSDIPEPEKPKLSKDDESIHLKAQSQLVKLGFITGCSVWVASNDRNKSYMGKSLGEKCLKSLPNLGLDKEAMSRISLIDVIWIRQNAPLCAFEVEATTSIYSGLLRMADLLSLIPVINMKLFIVAPKSRQDKVMSELARPTFRKIGLNEFCRFIAAEELETLVLSVESLKGHLQPTIVETLAVELEETQ
jgi:hypothetical protein